MVSLPQNLNQCFDSQIMKLCDSTLGQQGAPPAVRQASLSQEQQQVPAVMCHCFSYLDSKETEEGQKRTDI